MKSSREPSVLPYAVCFALMVLGIVFPAMFFRDLASWAILLGIGPFALLSLFGLWLILDGITKAQAGPK